MTDSVIAPSAAARRAVDATFVQRADRLSFYSHRKRSELGRDDAYRNCRRRPDGREYGSAPDGDRHRLTVWNRSADKVKPLADAGAAVAKTPAELAGAVEAVITIITNAAAIDAGLSRPERAVVRRREGQAVHRDEHGAAGDADGARREGARQGRGLCRMPGRRQRRAGARRQADGQHGRRARRRRACPADPRQPVPPRAARRSCRQRRGAQARGQSAADDLLAGARRATAAVQGLKIDPADLLDFLSETSGAATVLKQRMPGIISKLKNEPSDIKTFTLDNGIKDVKAMLEQGRKADWNCRSWKRRWPATRRRGATRPGRKKYQTCRPIGRGAPRNRTSAIIATKVRHASTEHRPSFYNHRRCLAEGS